MRTLVTGAFGYLGLALVRHLSASRNHEVTAVGHRPRVPVALPGIEIMEADIRELTIAGTRRHDAVVHLAGGGGSGGCVDPVGSYRSNVESTAHVVGLAPNASMRVLASTIYLYAPSKQPISEVGHVAPDSLYGAQKWVAESIWLAHGGAALRLAHVYGAGARIDVGRDGVTERLARAQNGGPPFVLRGGGSQLVDLVHVDDVCEAFAMMLTPPAPKILNIGGGRGVMLQDLVAAFGLDVPAPSSQPALMPRVMDTSLASRTLGWQASTSLKAGAQELVEFFGGQK